MYIQFAKVMLEPPSSEFQQAALVVLPDPTNNGVLRPLHHN
jgi:hypothetical protein